MQLIDPVLDIQLVIISMLFSLGWVQLWGMFRARRLDQWLSWLWTTAVARHVVVSLDQR